MKGKKKQNLNVIIVILIMGLIVYSVVVYSVYRSKMGNLYEETIFRHLDTEADYYVTEMDKNIGVIGQFNAEQLDKDFHEFSLGSQSWIALVNEEGKVIYYFSERDDGYVTSGSNLYKELEAAQSKESDRLMEAIAERESGYIYLTEGNVTGNLFYRPIETKPWYMMMGVSDYYVDKQMVEYSKLYTGLMISLFLGISVFVGLFVYIVIVDRIYGKEKRAKLAKLAETDQLTLLYNKVTTEKKIKTFMNENPDSQSMLFVLDIDNFKKINDTMGHAFGDEVLRAIGQRIKMEFRASDIIGRAGGDEFVIFLKNLREEEYLIKEAQKVEQVFKDFKVGNYTKYAATASIGCAVFPRDGEDFETLYKAADQALYKAKKRGKNQLAFYKEPEGIGQSV